LQVSLAWVSILVTEGITSVKVEQEMGFSSMIKADSSDGIVTESTMDSLMKQYDMGAVA
jgi:hypothetical protein